MTDVLLVAIILVLAALGAVVWYSTRGKRKAQAKPVMPLPEFFVTVLALINSFIVIILGIWYIYGARIRPSWLMAGIFLALGVAGIAFAYVDRFRKRKAQAVLNLVAKGVKKPIKKSK